MIDDPRESKQVVVASRKSECECVLSLLQNSVELRQVGRLQASRLAAASGRRYFINIMCTVVIYHQYGIGERYPQQIGRYPREGKNCRRE